MLDDQTYPITAGDAFVFSEGMPHSTINTGNEERLLIAMSEFGFHVQEPLAEVFFLTSPSGLSGFSYLSLSPITIFGIPPPLPSSTDDYFISLSEPSIDWTPPPGKIFDGWRFLSQVDGFGLSTPFIGTTPESIYRPGETYTFNPGTNCLLAPNWIDPPSDNICLLRGTPVRVDGASGDVPIEQLQAGKHTIHGRQIVAISQTRHKTNYLVCFEPHALGPNVPSQRTVMSHTHRVLYQRHWHPAQDFLGAFSPSKVKKVPYQGDILYNVLLDKHESMRVNNMTLETLNPASEVAKALFAKVPSKKDKYTF